MNRRLADEQKDDLKIRLVRLVISSFEEVDIDSISDKQILSWLEKLDIVNQGRVKYLESLADFLYEGIRPNLIHEQLLHQGEEEKPPPDKEQSERAIPEANAKTNISIAKKHKGPFPDFLDIPKATISQTYHYQFDLEQYYSGHILSPEIEGLDAVRGVDFSVSDLKLKGKPKEPGVYDMALIFLREDQMDRDAIRFQLVIEPDRALLPEVIKMPLARVDDPYEEMVPLDRSYKFNFRIEGAAEVGMEFDPDTLMLIGSPTRQGDYEFTLHFFWEGMRQKTTDCVKISLEVEPAEESFWQNVFPDAHSKFSKPLEEHKLQDAQNHWLLGASIRGLRHRHLGLHREDDFQMRYHTREGWSILAVADGHPDASFARKGSELATKVVEQVVNKRLEHYFKENGSELEDTLFLKEDKLILEKTQAFLNHTLTTAIYNAYLYIKRFAESESISLDSFATSLKLLLVYPIAKKGFFIAGTVIGDGVIAIYDEKKHLLERIQDKLPISNEEVPHLLTTPAICGNAKLLNQNVSWFFVEDFSFIALMSGGLTDSLFFDERNVESPTSWAHYWQQLKKQVLLTKGESIDKKLLDWLENPSENKKGFEDRTIAMMIKKSF